MKRAYSALVEYMRYHLDNTYAILTALRILDLPIDRNTLPHERPNQTLGASYPIESQPTRPSPLPIPCHHHQLNQMQRRRVGDNLNEPLGIIRFTNRSIVTVFNRPILLVGASVSDGCYYHSKYQATKRDFIHPGLTMSKHFGRTGWLKLCLPHERQLPLIRSAVGRSVWSARILNILLNTFQLSGELIYCQTSHPNYIHYHGISIGQNIIHPLKLLQSQQHLWIAHITFKDHHSTYKRHQSPSID
ncbi:uncharacterized protein MELLADRAFT_94849 [Melampsora larici-populina 98AG31]|uniref:Uncharacterized protein n=1 Tax=Melampsora larici-populina (strain 98AG31 / pathotype 3-4-7) TaxID=747676 RepID=F4S854_MELLP|nr:uncharacterized protein MELLADRAFT_94849 [Melampsora larici-populina 98AG31]EGF99130.1 hypothetical protein MELLADRAFT_94849 [Melampsora larici-populina 98AG31]